MSIDTLAHVISVASELTGDRQRAESLIRAEPLAAFGARPPNN